MDIQWFKAISGKEKKKTKNTHTLSNFLRNNFVDKGTADLQGALLGSDMPSTVTHQRLQPAEDGLCDAPEGPAEHVLLAWRSRGARRKEV